jgi:transposase
VLSVDRYSAYGKFARQTPGVELAICWAHQRRDFLRVANDHPPLWGWAMGWVEQIGVLYALHARRRACADAPEDAARVDEQLRATLDAMRKRCDSELA